MGPSLRVTPFEECQLPEGRERRGSRTRLRKRPQESQIDRTAATAMGSRSRPCPHRSASV